MIVGTAGHIDHGKTTLVKALTGVDTDRLPEEKKRGISIELGYAFLDLPGDDQRIGFIDVPGHERLVHTMLAGATGIDLALLLVAADDGPMPQTREHLAVLSLLGLPRGAVVLTKVDRVDAARLETVRAELAGLLAGSALQGATVFALSATRGDGVALLRDWLVSQAQAMPTRGEAQLAFRLGIDRAFTLDGVGTVVTGTVFAGQVTMGDELLLVPGNTPVRVRGLHAQNRRVEVAHAGQRCAVALAGVAREAVQRGQWLSAPLAALATNRLDAQLTLWHGETRPLRSGQPVQVHLGSAAMPGSIALLDADWLLPGASARVQLVLRQPIGAWRGQRLVLRDASASRTLAGGQVLDPFAPVRYRRTPQRLAELAAWALPMPEQRLYGLLEVAERGVDVRRWRCAEGLLQMPALPPDALRVQGADHDLALHAAAARVLASALQQTLREFHAGAPEELGPDAARARRLVAPRLSEALWHGLLARAVSNGEIAQRGAFIHLPEHGLRLSAVDQRIAQKVGPRLLQAGFEGAWVRDLARDANEGEVLMRTTLARLAQGAEVHQVVKDLYYAPTVMARLAALAREVSQRDGEVRAGSFRDVTQLGRKRAIQVLEYFDRVGLLRRVGDAHRLRGDSLLFVADEQPAAAPAAV